MFNVFTQKTLNALNVLYKFELGVHNMTKTLKPKETIFCSSTRFYHIHSYSKATHYDYDGKHA